MICNKLFNSLMPVFLLAVLLSACSAPRVSEVFVPSSQKDSLGRYAFELDMSDSLASYDISFYTRLDCSVYSFDNVVDIPVYVWLTSPSGELFAEQVFLPKRGFSAERPGSYDCMMEYRTGCIPAEYGQWGMALSVSPITGLRGMGVILTKNKDNGKR